MELLADVRDLLLPVLWYDEGADITPEWVTKFKGMVLTPFLIIDIFTYGGIAMGSLIILSFTARKYFVFCNGTN